ncbi:hypothetical protein TSAR_012307 [Trichomalopsis sarcophagae]|uniref:Uncharacterized protein n=1 Tax=Trichomalopsis sarcophagae TaxID=543379 RepID=A0A232FNZ5_9HYME|nr:hypothetical protein TSAR_012307 [Trichomalopsis sarcophagae]
MLCQGTDVLRSQGVGRI